MAGHRPFRELRDQMSAQSSRRVSERVAATLAEVAANEARMAAPQQPPPGAASVDDAVLDTAPVGAASCVPNVEAATAEEKGLD